MPPRNKNKPHTKASTLAANFSADGIVAEGMTLACRNCGISLGDVNSMKKFQIEQHIRTMKHKNNSDLKKKYTSPIAADKLNSYSSDLCKALIAANIPLFTINNKELSEFLEKYTQLKTPDESTLRKSFLNDAYEETIDEIRKDIGNGPIWCSVDETTDVEGRYVANVIVGKLSHEEVSESYLIHCAELTATNSTTIAKIFNDAMHKLWPSDLNEKMDQVFLFVSDAAAYMKKAVTNLQILYRNMTHVTCAAHGLHRVCELIRSEYPLTDSLISSVKKIFLKAPSRVHRFKEMYPDLPLPPRPVTTRWGTWLAAAEYYADHWIKIKAIVEALENDALSIESAKAVIANPKLIAELTKLKANYVFIGKSITELESAKHTLAESLSIIQNTVEKLIASAPDTKIKQKMALVLDKNVGLKALSAVATLNMEQLAKYKTFENIMSPSELSCFKYAPIVSCDVERSFSLYKRVLTDRRRCFTFQNLAMHVVIACNNKKLNSSKK